MSNACVGFLLFLLNFVCDYPGKFVMTKILKIRDTLCDLVLLYNLKNAKYTHRVVMLLIKLQAN